MKIEKVLETVFIAEYNTTAQILENRVVVRLWGEKYMDWDECIEHINNNFKGWVQTSKEFRKRKEAGEDCGILNDPIANFEKLYENINLYAKSKFGDEYSYDKLSK